MIRRRPAAKPYNEKRSPPASGTGFLMKSILSIDDLFLVISSALLADSVGKHKLSALGAFNQIVFSHFPIGPSLVPVSLR